jgi:acylphosphatase
MTGPEPGSGPTQPDPAAPARLEASVRGRVQGVGFRYFVLREAMYLGLTGLVANERDGGVRVLAEGPRVDLLELLDRLREGPPASIVERVVERWEPARGAGSTFRIESGEHRGD